MSPFTGTSKKQQNFIAGFFLGVILALAVVACSPKAPQVSFPSQAVITIDKTSSPALTLNPTATPAPSRTPTSTESATIPPASTPAPHPMSILAARGRSYPGSQVTVEETLEPGANYYRYRAWYESDGLRIYGLLTVPFGEKPANGWPAIVFNHGYIPPSAYRTTERYVAYVDTLARHGYIVFKIDYRGHDRSAGDASGAYGDPGYTDDVLNAVYALQSDPQVDPERIGMWGHSMGGFLTLRAMVISPSIKAGVIWSGVVGSYPDLVCCWHHPTPGVPTRTPNPNFRSGWRTLWQDLYGSPEANPGFWMEISANSYLQDLSGPLQLHHTMGDSEVPVQFSQDLYQQILAAGKLAEYYEYPGNDHNIANYFSLAMQRTVEFFDLHLKDGR